jgi:membrane-associated protein
LSREYGVLVYAILFAIIFAETGFVVTPFLPGRLALFVAGAIAAVRAPWTWNLLAFTLAVAAIAGNRVTTAVGRWLGKQLSSTSVAAVAQPQHLEKAHAFYERHGGKAVVISRFLPIVRTYVPFVAGMAAMPRARTPPTTWRAACSVGRSLSTRATSSATSRGSRATSRSSSWASSW